MVIELNPGPTLVLIVVVFERNPTRQTTGATGSISLTVPVVYQVIYILAPGIMGQRREFESPRVRTRINFRLVH